MQVKDYVVDNGVMYYPKKPFYKQVFFWTSLIGFLLALFFGISTLLLSTYSSVLSAAGAGHDQSYVEDYYDTSAVYRDFQVGDRVEFTDGLAVQLKDLESDTGLSLADPTYDLAVVANLVIENTSDQDLYFDETSFFLVDAQLESLLPLDGRTYDINLPEKLAAGEEVQIKLVFAAFADQDQSSLVLVYDDANWSHLLTEGV